MNVRLRENQYTDVTCVRRWPRTSGRTTDVTVYLYRRGRAYPVWTELRNFHIRLRPVYS